MLALSGPFHVPQGRLLRDGPSGLQQDARKLLDDVAAFERSSMAFFGT